MILLFELMFNILCVVPGCCCLLHHSVFAGLVISVVSSTISVVVIVAAAVVTHGETKFWLLLLAVVVVPSVPIRWSTFRPILIIVVVSVAILVPILFTPIRSFPFPFALFAPSFVSF